MAEDGMTMVVVTHKMSFARDVANKVIFIDNGLILQNGTPIEVVKNTDNLRVKQFLNVLTD